MWVIPVEAGVLKKNVESVTVGEILPDNVMNTE